MNSNVEGHTFKGLFLEIENKTETERHPGEMFGIFACQMATRLEVFPESALLGRIM